MNKLTKTEKELERSYERGEWKPVSNRKGEIRRYQSYVRDALQKSKRINIRLSPQDLEGMQQRAVEEGIPYQTLVASVIHKFVTGRLIERGV
jgi:predicted DNA binding CopG/RHH family protein